MCVVDEMYVLSASNKRVSVELVGKEKIQDKLSRFEELTGASLSYLGVSSPGSATDISNVVPSKLVSQLSAFYDLVVLTLGILLGAMMKVLDLQP